MKRITGIASLTSIIFVTLIFSSHAVPSSNFETREKKNVFFVTLKNQFDLNHALSKLGQVKITPLLGGAIIEVEVLEGDAHKMIQSLKNHPSIINVVPNFKMPLKRQEQEDEQEIEYIPYEIFPKTDYTWWKKNDGQYHSKVYEFNKKTKKVKILDDIPSKIGADINLDEAHRIETGNPGVIIAVIDSGIDLNHPALANSLYTNPGEIPGNNTDDDGNGYVDDVNGWNFGTNSGDVSDKIGHGTMVSGVIAGNGDGFEGVCPECKILPIVLDGFLDGLLNSINYIKKQNVKVINMSLAWDMRDLPEEDRGTIINLMDTIIKILSDDGIVIVAAAGNSGHEGNPISYPAYFEETIAVGGSDPWDMDAYFSNYGPWVDIVAPAVDIWTTQPLGGIDPHGIPFNSKTGRSGYNYFSGTSFAAPMVAGAAALLLSHYPHMTASEVKQTLLYRDNTQLVTDTLALRPPARRLDIGRALRNPIFSNQELLLEVPDMPNEERDEIDPLELVWH